VTLSSTLEINVQTRSLL